MNANSLREQLRTAMDNAMCGDACFDENCPKCAGARLTAICLVVHGYLTVSLKPLRPLIDAGFIPPETVHQLRHTLEDLKRDPS